MKRPTITKKDCQSCGACCINPFVDGHGRSYVDLDEKDVKRLARGIGARRAARLTIKPEHAVFDRAVAILMNDEPISRVLRAKTKRFVILDERHTAESCIALDGTVGEDVTCRIYKHRPQACRDFEPGDVYCFRAREELGL